MVFRRTSLSAEDFHGALDSSRAVDAGLLEMSAIWKDTSNAPVTFFFYHSYFIYIKSHHKIVKSLKQRKMIFHRSNYIFFFIVETSNLWVIHYTNMEFCMAPRQKFKPNNMRTIHIREPTNYRVFVYSESYLSLCHCPLTMAKCITDPTCVILQRLSAPRTWQTVRRKIYGA